MRNRRGAPAWLSTLWAVLWTLGGLPTSAAALPGGPPSTRMTLPHTRTTAQGRWHFTKDEATFLPRGGGGLGKRCYGRSVVESMAGGRPGAFDQLRKAQDPDGLLDIWATEAARRRGAARKDRPALVTELLHDGIRRARKDLAAGTPLDPPARTDVLTLSSFREGIDYLARRGAVFQHREDLFAQRALSWDRQTKIDADHYSYVELRSWIALGGLSAPLSVDFVVASEPTRQAEATFHKEQLALSGEAFGRDSAFEDRGHGIAIVGKRRGEESFRVFSPSREGYRNFAHLKQLTDLEAYRQQAPHERIAKRTLRALERARGRKKASTQQLERELALLAKEQQRIEAARQHEEAAERQRLVPKAGRPPRLGKVHSIILVDRAPGGPRGELSIMLMYESHRGQPTRAHVELPHTIGRLTTIAPGFRSELFRFEADAFVVRGEDGEMVRIGQRIGRTRKVEFDEGVIVFDPKTTAFRLRLPRARRPAPAPQ